MDTGQKLQTGFSGGVSDRDMQNGGELCSHAVKALQEGKHWSSECHVPVLLLLRHHAVFWGTLPRS